MLEIYLIEDHKERRDKIIEYFVRINKLIESGAEDDDYKNVLDCFRKHKFEKINVIPILPDEGEEMYSDYYFGNNEEWVKEIGQILEQKKENRIFLIDLALNHDERALFGKSESSFRAETTIDILEYISEHSLGKEYIVFESILRDIGIGGCPALDMEQDDIREGYKYWFMRGNYFVKGQDQYEIDFGIAETFEEVLKEINDDKARI